TVEGVLYGWKHQAGQSPSSSTFARICPGPTFTIDLSERSHSEGTLLRTPPTLSKKVTDSTRNAGLLSKWFWHSSRNVQIAPKFPG
ncbi:hypothetical protein D8O01_19570, partial [Acinetobacter baumannii]